MLDYGSDVSGNVFIRFLVSENHIIDTKILILGAIEKKLAKPPVVMAAILDFRNCAKRPPLAKNYPRYFSKVHTGLQESAIKKTSTRKPHRNMVLDRTIVIEGLVHINCFMDDSFVFQWKEIELF